MFTDRATELPEGHEPRSNTQDLQALRAARLMLVFVCVQSIAGAGFDWKFSEVAVMGVGLSGFLMRAMSVVVSIGGMLITALLLGIVSGAARLLCGKPSMCASPTMQTVSRILVVHMPQGVHLLIQLYDVCTGVTMEMCKSMLDVSNNVGMAVC